MTVSRASRFLDCIHCIRASGILLLFNLLSRHNDIFLNICIEHIVVLHCCVEKDVLALLYLSNRYLF